MKVVQMEVIISDDDDNDIVEEITSRDITKALRHAYNNNLKIANTRGGMHIKQQIRIFSVDYVE